MRLAVLSLWSSASRAAVLSELGTDSGVSASGVRESGIGKISFAISENSWNSGSLTSASGACSGNSTGGSDGGGNSGKLDLADSESVSASEGGSSSRGRICAGVDLAPARSVVASASAWRSAEDASCAVVACVVSRQTDMPTTTIALTARNPMIPKDLVRIMLVPN